MIKDIRLHPAAMKVLNSLNEKDKKRLVRAIKKLAGDPKKLDIKKLRGTKGRHDVNRLRVGDFRIIYHIEDNIIWITDIFTRGKDYQQY